MQSAGTILLAEDNGDEVVLLECALAAAGFSNPLAVVQDGKEAIEYLRGEGRYAARSRYPFPFLVLLDFKLPRLNGFEVLRWIRQQPELKPLPVIVLTCVANHSLTLQAQKLGADSCLARPLAFRELVAKVKEQLHSWLGEDQWVRAAS